MSSIDQRTRASASVTQSVRGCSSGPTSGSALSSRARRAGCSVHRYYDPGSDQFLSVDPAIAQTGQAYAFANNDPLNVTDPLGLSGWYCMEGVSEYYAGNYYGSVGAGKCGAGVHTYDCARTDYQCNSAVSSAQATYLRWLASQRSEVQPISNSGGGNPLESIGRSVVSTVQGLASESWSNTVSAWDAYAHAVNRIPGATWVNENITPQCVITGAGLAIDTVETGGGDLIAIAAAGVISRETATAIAGSVGFSAGCGISKLEPN